MPVFHLKILSLTDIFLSPKKLFNVLKLSIETINTAENKRKNQKVPLKILFVVMNLTFRYIICQTVKQITAKKNASHAPRVFAIPMLNTVRKQKTIQKICFADCRVEIIFINIRGKTSKR